MPLPAMLTPIIVGAAGTAVGAFFQDRSAKIAKQRALREAELGRAQEIFKEVSQSMDQVWYFLAHSAMYVAVRQNQGDTSRKVEDTESWEKYEDALLAWKTNLNRYHVQVKRYFGDEAAKTLSQINEKFELARRQVDATYYKKQYRATGQMGSIVRGGKGGGANYELYEPKTARQPIEDLMKGLTDRIVQAIQHETVGLLRD